MRTNKICVHVNNFSRAVTLKSQQFRQNYISYFFSGLVWFGLVLEQEIMKLDLEMPNLY